MQAFLIAELLAARQIGAVIAIYKDDRVFPDTLRLHAPDDLANLAVGHHHRVEMSRDGSTNARDIRILWRDVHIRRIAWLQTGLFQCSRHQSQTLAAIAPDLTKKRHAFRHVLPVTPAPEPLPAQ